MKYFRYFLCLITLVPFSLQLIVSGAAPMLPEPEKGGGVIPFASTNVRLVHEKIIELDDTIQMQFIEFDEPVRMLLFYQNN